MSTKNSRRGAARLNAIWTIVAFVLFFVAFGASFVISDDAAQLRRELTTVKEELQKAQDSNAVEIKKWQEVSTLLGYRGDSSSVPSNLEAAAAALTSIKAAFPNTDGVKTFQDLLPLTQTALLNQQKENEALRTRNADLESQVRQGMASLNDVRREKDQNISTLRSELGDAQKTASSQISSLESDKANLIRDRNRLDESVKARQNELAELNRKIDETKAQYQSYVRNKTRELNDMRRAAERADGEVTAVSTELGKVWINLGANDRLSAGTVFRVTGSDPADVKGFIEVLEVEPNRAVCKIQSLTNKFSPIVVSHQIWNDLYEAKGRRYAVLAGRFDGTWNEKEIRLLLDEIGITVQDGIDINTDFLIAGAARAVENEEGESVMEQVADTTVYKDAVSRGLTILSIRDIEQYFKR